MAFPPKKDDKKKPADKKKPGIGKADDEKEMKPSQSWTNTAEQDKKKGKKK